MAAIIEREWSREARRAARDAVGQRRQASLPACRSRAPGNGSPDPGRPDLDGDHAASHDPKLDDLALLEALRSNAFYVGAIGSRANQARRRERLAVHFDMTPQELDRLHGPVGLKNGARTPPEIAVAILAELTAARYGFRIPEPVRIEPRAHESVPARDGPRLARAA